MEVLGGLFPDRANGCPIPLSWGLPWGELEGVHLFQALQAVRAEEVQAEAGIGGPGPG